RYGMHVFVNQTTSGVLSGTVAVMLTSLKRDLSEFIFRPVHTSCLQCIIYTGFPRIIPK
ncbi:hypothetical protein COCMIDRAFT_108527, partial [Bipolaris oryzae ATCC 44560]